FQAAGHHCYLSAVQPDNPGRVKLLIAPGEARTELRLSYYDAEFAGFRLLDRLNQVMDQLLSGSERLADLDWLLADEREQQLQTWQGASQDLSADTVLTLIDR